MVAGVSALHMTALIEINTLINKTKNQFHDIYLHKIYNNFFFTLTLMLL